MAFRSSRNEPFGERFLRRALDRLLSGDVPGVREAYLETLDALRRREVPTYDVSSRVRLTKTPAEYLAVRDSRRELPYEAMLASGQRHWTAGERVRVYRARGGAAAVVEDPAEASAGGSLADPRDYDIEHYVRVLRGTYATRMERAFAPADFTALFADPDQLSLFSSPIAGIRPILTARLRTPDTI